MGVNIWSEEEGVILLELAFTKDKGSQVANSLLFKPWLPFGIMLILLPFLLLLPYLPSSYLRLFRKSWTTDRIAAKDI